MICLIPSEETPMKKCGYCGHANDDDATVCSDCGTDGPMWGRNFSARWPRFKKPGNMNEWACLVMRWAGVLLLVQGFGRFIFSLNDPPILDCDYDRYTAAGFFNLVSLLAGPAYYAVGKCR